MEKQRETQLEHEPPLQVSHGHIITKYFNLSSCRKGTKSKHGAGHVWVLASETEGEGSYDRVGHWSLCRISHDCNKYCVSRLVACSLSNLSVMRQRQLKLSGKF